MKKKHLHGKLSLRIKDLSALDGNAQQQLIGGSDTGGTCTCDCTNIVNCTQTQGCPPPKSMQGTCDGENTCATCNGDNTCQGNTCLNVSCDSGCASCQIPTC